MAKRKNEPKPITGRALGTEAFLALVHRTSAGPMKTSKRDLPRSEAKRRALHDEA